MKPLITLAAAMLCATLGSAQVETGKPVDHKNEFGVEITNFYGLINTNFQSNNPYLVTYRRHFGTWALRAGAGGTLNTQNNLAGGSQVSKNTDMSLNFSTGCERQMWFGKRWGFYYGGDFTFFRGYLGQLENPLGEQTLTETNTQRIGIAPLAGFRFRLNQRLSMGTTANFWIGSENTKVDVRYKNFQDPSQNSVNNSSTDATRGYFNSPYSIYLLLDF